MHDIKAEGGVFRCRNGIEHWDKWIKIKYNYTYIQKWFNETHFFVSEL